MRWHEISKLSEGVGLIVPGVNTTPDVGPNQTSIEAKKLGFSVDKAGKPKYTMHKKASKNTKANTLYNLGMTESKDPALHIRHAIELEARAEEIWKRSVSRQFQWKSSAQKLRQIGKVIQAGQDPKKFIRDLNMFYNQYISFIQKNKLPNEIIKLLKQIQKLLVDNIKNESIKDLEEALGEIASATEIYVDMDGVLADFFPAWKKIVGKDWRQITDIEDALQKIRDKDDFWLNLPLTANAQNLLNIIKDLKGEYTILSAPLANDPRAEPHKREWVKKNLAFFPPKEVIVSADKYKWAKQADGTPNILIDDFGSNIRNWESKGGVGFKHKDHKFERTAGLLKDYFTKPAKEG